VTHRRVTVKAARHGPANRITRYELQTTFQRLKPRYQPRSLCFLQKVRVDETPMRQHTEGRQEEVRQSVHAEVARLLAEQYTQGISRMRGILGDVTTEQLELALQFDADITNDQLGIAGGRHMYTIEAERRRQMRSILEGQAPVPAEHKDHPYAVKYLRHSWLAIEARAVESDEPATIKLREEPAPPPLREPARPNEPRSYEDPLPPSKESAGFPTFKRSGEIVRMLE
jgi:hypothetical protein